MAETIQSATPTVAVVASPWQRFLAWTRQTTTVHGIAVASTAIAAAASGTLTWKAAGLGVLGAAIMAVMPGSDAADALAAVLEKGVPQPGK